jgi:hypothetical protein
MAKCGACNSTILMGGTQWSAWACCDDNCVSKLKRALTGKFVPMQDIQQETETLHAGTCVLCKRAGPNDVYSTRKVTGMILAVQWSQDRHVCCAKCAKSKRFGAALHCLFLGWWSPKALITNVFFLPYNLISVLFTRPTKQPSKALTNMVMEIIADNNAAKFAAMVQQGDEQKQKPSRVSY